MKAQFISDQLERLKVNSVGAIRNKGRVKDAILAKHLKETDELIMKIRFHVARSDMFAHDIGKLDEYLYKLQIN